MSQALTARQNATTEGTLPPLVLTVTRNNPRLAKEGFKTFQGLANDERNMIIQAINTLLHNDKDKMRRLLTQHTIRTYKRKAMNEDLTLDELRDFLLEVAKENFVQSTGEAPHRLKYHNKFLDKYYASHDQTRTSSQETLNEPSNQEEISPNKDRDIDDDSATVIPQMETEPHQKKPRTMDLTEDTNQTTLTQIWTPTRKTYPTQTQEAQDEDIDDDSATTPSKTPKHITIIYNPYTGTKTPMVAELDFKAESDFKSLIRGISKPQANLITNQILAKLKADTTPYTQKLEKDYFDKQAEMISDLDHYQDKASEVLEEAMDDFYHYTVPVTIPPKLTKYLDQHLEKRE
jgi:hypothetical protein